MEKNLPAIPPKRYFTIGEVSDLCDVKPHVLRYWEQEFSQLKPVKRRGNRRYYQNHEVLMVRRIRELLYEQGFTISGARNQLQEWATPNPGADLTQAASPGQPGAAPAQPQRVALAGRAGQVLRRQPGRRLFGVVAAEVHRLAHQRVADRLELRLQLRRGPLGQRVHQRQHLHAIGGAASFIAQSVKQVLGVYKLEFGVPEAFWVIQVEDFPAVVTMDAHGQSQHAVIDEASKKVLDELLAKPY